MQDIAISVRGLSKRYQRVASQRASYGTLRDSISSVLRSWFQPSVKSDLGDFWALSDLSFDVPRGEVLGVIGRNGAGKSTLLKILSRITEPTTGEVDLYGRVGSLLEVGTGFHPELSGRENIYLNGALLGMKRAEIRRQFDAIVEFAEIAEFLDTPVKRYSSGMYMRLAFAVAAHLEPEILIVDEVLAVGDAAFQKKCLGKMDEVSRSGRTILFVSHNMSAISSLCHRCILLESGRIISNGRTDDVLSDYNRLVSPSQSTLSSEDLIFDISVAESAEISIDVIALCDESLQALKQVKTWDHVTFALRYRANESLVNAHVVLELADCYGRKLTSFHSNVQMTAIDTTKPEGWIEIHIPQLPLAAGEYSLSVGVFIPDQRVVSFKNHAVLFYVQPNDVFGCGRAEEQPRSTLVLTHQWKMSLGHLPFLKSRDDAGV